MKKLLSLLLMFCAFGTSRVQEITLEHFLEKVQQTNDSLYSSVNLQKIGQLQQQIIIAQNRAPQVDALANLVFAPYFNNNGRVIGISTNPSPNAFGYDAGISNGQLYAAQLKVTQQLFNRAITNTLLFQNKVQNDGFALTYEEVYHNLKYNITRLYVTAYGYQLQEELNQNLLADLEKRLKIIGILVKNGILLQSDYLLVQVNLDQTKIQLQQVRNDRRESLRQLYSLSADLLNENAALSFPGLAIMPKKDVFFFEKRFFNDS